MYNVNFLIDDFKASYKDKDIYDMFESEVGSLEEGIKVLEDIINKNKIALNNIGDKTSKKAIKILDYADKNLKEYKEREYESYEYGFIYGLYGYKIEMSIRVID